METQTRIVNVLLLLLLLFFGLEVSSFKVCTQVSKQICKLKYNEHRRKREKRVKRGTVLVLRACRIRMYVHVVPSGSRDRSIFSIQGCCVKAIITVYVAQYRHHDRITVFKRRYATLCHVMLTIYQKRYKT